MKGAGRTGRRRTRAKAAARLAIAVGTFISAALIASIIGADGAPAPSRDRAGEAASPAVFRVPPTVYRVEALGRLAGRMTEALVVRVVDGDTIQVRPARGIGLGELEKLRLIGVDTPETVDPRRPVQPFGKEAAAYLKGRILGRRVLLAFESSLRDRYGRLLAYVFLEDGTCVNRDIVADGFGHAYLKYPFLFVEDFLAAEREARSKGRGLWAASR